MRSIDSLLNEVATGAAEAGESDRRCGDCGHRKGDHDESGTCRATVRVRSCMPRRQRSCLPPGVERCRCKRYVDSGEVML